MDYEKKYKEVLSKAKDMLSYKEIRREDAEYLFPELKETEDEKIRKEIISFLKEGKPYYCPNSVRRQEWANWLEKQGGKSQDKLTNNANKVKPKFNVGDWVIDKQNIVHQIANVIENVTTHSYGYDIVGGGYFNDRIEGIRLWTIQDAKDGDVLADGNTPFIFKGLIDPHHPGQPVAYGGVDCENNFIVGSGSEGGTNWWCSCKRVKPATKKQRDLLFRKMKKAGYEWNHDKKELKSISIERN